MSYGKIAINMRLRKASQSSRLCVALYDETCSENTLEPKSLAEFASKVVNSLNNLTLVYYITPGRVVSSEAAPVV